MHQRHYDLPLARSSGTLNEHVVSIDDVFVAHRVASDLEGENVSIADDIVKRDALGSDSAGQGETVTRSIASSRRQNVDGTTSIVNAIEHSFFFEVCYVFVDGRQALQPHATRNLLKRRGIAVAGDKGLEKVDHFFLPSSDSHGRIIANKKRSAIGFFAFLSPFRLPFANLRFWLKLATSSADEFC
jgi:hypothetical protein